MDAVAETYAAGVPALLVEGARKTYGTGAAARHAVRNVTLRVSPGEVHGLLGPNGAGKTTTLKMLLGLVQPSAGRFEILGMPAGPAARMRLGFLPEQPYFPPQLTAGEILRLYGRLSGLDRGGLSRRAADVLERVGLQGRASSLLSTFSRGMLQRLGIAQAVLHEPDVVILDEPASGLDPVGQRDVRNLILELRERGVAVLLSSHQLSEVEAVCDQVTILNRGSIAAEGSISDLLNVRGQMSVRVRGPEGDLPAAVLELVSDIAFAGGEWMFSVPDARVREAVDALDEAGWELISLNPKRESLEDYFASLLGETPAEEDAA